VAGARDLESRSVTLFAVTSLVSHEIVEASRGVVRARGGRRAAQYDQKSISV